MRICHIITRLIVGGAQENTLLTCEGLHRRGHAVLLLTGTQEGPEGSLWARARQGGYEVRAIPNLVREISLSNDWRCPKGLRAEIARFAPDVVHTHSSKAGVLGRFAAHRAGTKAVLHTIHGMSFNRTQSGPVRTGYRAVERICARWTDRFITVSDAMTDQAVRAGIATRDRFVTVYSGMEVDAFDPEAHDGSAVRATLGIAGKRIVVATVARLQANKGYEQLIELMPALLAEQPNLHFLWIGDGPLRSRYEEMLHARKLRDRVTLAGLVSPDRVPELLSASDLLVHLSRWEGLPRAMVQAALMQRPVVGYEIDGAPEAVAHGETGYVAALDDLEAVKTHILELAGNAEKRAAFGRAGREHCRTRFDHDTMVDRLQEMYRELI